MTQSKCLQECSLHVTGRRDGSVLQANPLLKSSRYMSLSLWDLAGVLSTCLSNLKIETFMDSPLYQTRKGPPGSIPKSPYSETPSPGDEPGIMSPFINK